MAGATYESINLKNKVDKSTLNYKLEQLNKAKKADIRMRNTIKQRFRAKYGSINDFLKIQAGDVHMYKTHNPGFCYHRDGQPREYDTVAAAVKSPDYQDILNLLFTNGELDTKKVLCLHVLSSHPCEALKPSNRPFARLNSREKTTMEMLIERSKFQCPTPAVSNLPIIILNVNQNKSKAASSGYNQKRYSNECCIRDGRLATRFVINDDISRLVQAVLEALQRSNPAKMSNLMRITHNSHFVKDIVNSSELEPFLQSLNNYSLLQSSSSFVLTRPFMKATHITVENPSQHLVKLVNKIRRNVLKDSAYFGNSQNYTSQFSNKFSGKGNMNEEEPAVVERHPASRGFNAEKMSYLLYNKIREAQERDMKQLKKSLARNSSNALSNDVEQHQAGPSPSVYDRLHARATVLPKKSDRRVACAACDDIYMNNLLPSKRLTERTSNYQTFNVDTFKALITKSTQWLNFRINEEAEKLHVDRIAKMKENRAKSKIREIPTKKNMTLANENRRSSYLLRKAKNYAQYYGYKSGESSHVVNNLNLAKIKHEISVKENSKRVKKFLDEPLFEKRVS